MILINNNILGFVILPDNCVVGDIPLCLKTGEQIYGNSFETISSLGAVFVPCGVLSSVETGVSGFAEDALWFADYYNGNTSNYYAMDLFVSLKLHYNSFADNLGCRVSWTPQTKSLRVRLVKDVE